MYEQHQQQMQPRNIDNGSDVHANEDSNRDIENVNLLTPQTKIGNRNANEWLNLVHEFAYIIYLDLITETAYSIVTSTQMTIYFINIICKFISMNLIKILKTDFCKIIKNTTNVVELKK